MEIDHEIITTAILPPSADSRSVVVSYKQMYVHKVLVNRLVMLAQFFPYNYIVVDANFNWSALCWPYTGDDVGILEVVWPF